MAMILKEKKAQDQAAGSQKVPQKSMRQFHSSRCSKWMKKADVVDFWWNLKALKIAAQQVAAYGSHLPAIDGLAFACLPDVDARCHPGMEEPPGIG